MSLYTLRRHPRTGRIVKQRNTDPVTLQRTPTMNRPSPAELPPAPDNASTSSLLRRLFGGLAVTAAVAGCAPAGATATRDRRAPVTVISSSWGDIEVWDDTLSSVRCYGTPHGLSCVALDFEDSDPANWQAAK